jgi:hypothetical protein
VTQAAIVWLNEHVGMSHGKIARRQLPLTSNAFAPATI